MSSDIIHRLWMDKFHMYSYVREYHDKNPSAKLIDLVNHIGHELQRLEKEETRRMLLEENE